MGSLLRRVGRKLARERQAGGEGNIADRNSLTRFVDARERVAVGERVTGKQRCWLLGN